MQGPRNLTYDLSWVWGPPEDHLAKLLRSGGHVAASTVDMPFDEFALKLVRGISQGQIE